MPIQSGRVTKHFTVRRHECRAPGRACSIRHLAFVIHYLVSNKSNSVSTFRNGAKLRR
jgi:hypothetical protein